MSLKQFPLLCAFTLTLLACNKQDTEENTLEENTPVELNNQITALQDEINTVSNSMVFQFQNPSITYTSLEVQEDISSFTSLRNDQSQKLSALSSKGGTPNIATLVCADFENMGCFVNNWDVLKDADQTLKFEDSTSYNNSNSLFMSSPHKMGAVNQRSLSINGYIKNVAAQTVYKIRFWAKYYGYTSKDNGPLIQISARQDGDWLGDRVIVVGDGSYTNEDWKLYSFQIITKTSSPIAIQLWTNMEHCWIDDIHIVTK